MGNGDWGMENWNHIILLTFIVELGGTRIQGGGKNQMTIRVLCADDDASVKRWKSK